MPEFYADGNCGYQKRAQPYLDPIARGVRDSAILRAFLLEGTQFSSVYANAEPLWQRQREQRYKKKELKCPFWANYWHEPCSSCNCRIDGSVSMEIDSIFFLKNGAGNTLAIHVEMKRDREPLKHGQADAYKPRAECYRDERRVREGVLKHDHFLTVLFCGLGTDVPLMKGHFDRVILHEDARKMFPGYPT